MSTLSDLLLAAGLTGRGGAAFPTGAKVALAERHDADLIVNACDGELHARKDGWVVAHHLPEMLAATEHLTRRRVRVAAHRDSPTLAALRAAGADTLAVPRRYVSSEESALTRLAHGGPARPVMRYRPIAAGGRDPGGRRLPPTLVLNAETVWRIQQIAEHGVRWFRSFGTADEPGPRLVTVVDGVAKPGVYDAEAGLPLSEILCRAGGPIVPVRALWLSGLSGGFLRAADADTAWSRIGLAPFGIAPGAGTVRVLDARADPWHDVLAALSYAAGESAGQCGPCMFGLPALRDRLTELVRHPTPGAADRLTRTLGQVPGRGACRHPDGTARFVASALDVFGTAPALLDEPSSAGLGPQE
ncbi:NADH-ubiquinone oxidoreductase-F iron-sulfur binding region domain-containing protein [Nocardia sp. BMG111209]|uniref:NADH-ubiquinone oxidoreductase-F iron-sulfur binding region domain-containing protein n=1 Tax=Nocardia sp. BMG111209 TaxID=1160137 RepID=UPI0003747254|nr:NADH-ubiquinone oxidoreductase-F iron-sulfur binding region domain-containing protein [Nocardia sp. BMG111209]